VSVMMKILEDLTPLNRIMCSRDYDRTVDYLRDVLPFTVLEYPRHARSTTAGSSPPSGMSWKRPFPRMGSLSMTAPGIRSVLSPLGAFRRQGIQGDAQRTPALRPPLQRLPDLSLPAAVPQLGSGLGILRPKNLFDALDPGEYDVRIVTQEASGMLKVLEHTHTGSLPYTIALCANLDHPGVANDGLAGVAVGVEVLRRLERRQTKYSYALVLAPGSSALSTTSVRSQRRSGSTSSNAFACGCWVRGLGWPCKSRAAHVRIPSMPWHM